MGLREVKLCSATSLSFKSACSAIEDIYIARYRLKIQESVTMMGADMPYIVSITCKTNYEVELHAGNFG
jgi:hypothetical protein